MFISCSAFSQGDQLAQNYFERGEFEKALLIYQDLLKSQPSNGVYFQRTIESMQQLEQFDAAQNAINDRLKTYRQAGLLVELGYNFGLRKNEAEAKKNYSLAIERINQNPSEVYGVASSFERHSLNDYALQSYKLAQQLDPRLSFNYQLAVLYGRTGKTDMMVDAFLDEAYANPQSSIMVQNQLSRFMADESDGTFNDMLRKSLLLRAQKKQDVFWNQYLSWFFVQQKEYGKAFIQEKAIYKRQPESFANIMNLAQLAIAEDEKETATEILQYVLDNTNDQQLTVQANFFLLSMQIKNVEPKDFPIIQERFAALKNQFGNGDNTLQLQILEAHFLAFSMQKPELGITILKNVLELNLTRYQAASVKMELADIFLIQEKFNQALLYYTQIEDDLKNDVIGHQASLKSGLASYYKGDFSWAFSQFKVLKTATTQLIANDALEYFLLINDNTVADSTQAALKKFAAADFLLYQNKNDKALIYFQNILKQFPGNEIESVTLLRMGDIYRKQKKYDLAISQYQEIIDKHSDGIYIDEALFYSAEIFRQLNQIEKAKANYEKIIFNHQDSIFYVDARKTYRQLRGDSAL